MATLIRPKLWGLQKPPPGSSINWGHPLANALLAYFPLNEGGGQPRNLVNDALPITVRNPANGWRRDGIFNVNQNGALYGWSPANWNSPSGAMSYWVDQQAPITSPPGSFSATLLKTYANQNSSPYTSYGMQWGGTFTQAYVNWGNSYPTNFTRVDVEVPSYSLRHQITGVYDPSVATVYGYGNGILHGSGSFTGPIVYDNSSSGQLLLGDSQPTTMHQPWTGWIYGAAIWGRVLTADEVAWLWSEPYAFLAPPAPMQRYWNLGTLPPKPPVALIRPRRW